MAWLKAASSGEILRSPKSPDGVSCSTALLKSPVRMTAPSFVHKSRMSNRSAMHTDLRLAHSLFMWTLATVKQEHDWSGGLRNLPVTTMPPKRTWDHKRRTRDVARKGVLLEEYHATVLGGHVDVLRQGTVGEEAGAFLHADNVPWAVEVACQRVRVRPPRWAWVPGEDLQLFGLPPLG